MSGSPPIPGPLAVKTTIENARTSNIHREGVKYEFSELSYQNCERSRTESHREDIIKEFPGPPPFVNADLERIQIYLWYQLHWKPT